MLRLAKLSDALITGLCDNLLLASCPPAADGIKSAQDF